VPLLIAFVFWAGSRLTGEVERSGTARIATDFFHVYWLPIAPAGSYLMIGPGIAGERAIPIGFHGPSVLAGYARTWGPVLLAAGLCVSFLAWRAALPIAALGFVLSLAGMGVGALREEDRARRRVYARHAFYEVDPVRLVGARTEIARELQTEILERVRRTIATGYRDAPAAIEGADANTIVALLDRIAADPAIRDAELLSAALTYARIESAIAPVAVRPRFAAAHDRLWSRIRELRLDAPAEAHA
jgi:hypothetical protein